MRLTSVLASILMLAVLALVAPASVFGGGAVVTILTGEDASVANGFAGGCVGLLTADVVYQEDVSYYVESSSFSSEGKIYVRGQNGKGMSLKEYVKKSLPDAKVLCVTINTHNRYFYILYTK